MADTASINVDLNKLFEAKLTYSFDPLKEVIEGLLRNQELQNRALHDLAEEQKELSMVKGETKDLKDQLKAQNDRINTLAQSLKDHEQRIEKLEKTSENHETRIESLEKNLENAKTTFDYSQTIINPGSENKSLSREKELENELKHLSDRLDNTQNSLNNLVKKRNDVSSTLPTSETFDDEDEDIRESLENQLQAIKTRLSRVEDSNDEIKQVFGNTKDKDDKNTSMSNDIDKEIRELKAKIKELEDKLRELKGRSSPARTTTKYMSAENSNVPADLLERLETLESSHEKTCETIIDHTERIEKLEKDNNTNKERISSNKQDIGEIKDTLPDKVDCDTFDQEINYLKEMINQLGSGKNIDLTQIPKPTSQGMSTKDTNKLKELSAKIPELENMIKEILERLKTAERGIDSHDKSLKDHGKSIEDIWAELGKKANAIDLKDLFDRLNQLEKDLKNIVDHINNSGTGKQAPLPVVNSDNSDKRMSLLEKKLEELRIHLNSSLRDLDKTIDALNSEMKGVKRDMESQKNDLLKFMKKVNDLELKLDALLKKGMPQATTVTSHIDNDALEELKKALSELRNDYRSFKNDVHNQFNQVNKDIDTKADREDLENLKNLLKNRLDELEKALNKTKNDLKRALKILNDKIAKVPEGGQREDKDDAMFTKRPLQGWSCASCDKNVVNLQGLPADYYNWKKLPQSKERIPMMGQGFSRMLQSISNEYLGNQSQTPMKTSYGGFKEVESINSGRSNNKNRPSSSDRRTMNVDDIETDAASKLLPSIKEPSNR